MTLEDVPADTVAAEFKTTENKLSVWKIENEDDLNDAFIAMALSSDSIGTIDAVLLEEDDLSKLKIEEEVAATPVIEANKKHRNIVELNYVNLGDVIKSILNALEKGDMVRKTKGTLRNLVVDACVNSSIQYDMLTPNTMKYVSSVINVGSSLQKDNSTSSNN